ncbi:hypothetical protein ACIBBE_41985 [Streptomyces sp. NPDC051644]|uniref:hypothetical protein n=1 Tax=Streptomyces sp. NPDC051644 TaxID=3365666 RepID=UPI0037BA0D1B
MTFRAFSKRSLVNLSQGAVGVALCRAADVDALPATRSEVDGEQLRTGEKGRRSPLASLQPTPA